MKRSIKYLAGAVLGISSVFTGVGTVGPGGAGTVSAHCVAAGQTQPSQTAFGREHNLNANTCTTTRSTPAGSAISRTTASVSG